LSYVPKSAKKHIQYRLADGTRVPGVTTITGQLAKHLEGWIVKLERSGTDYYEYMRTVANIGTAAHAMMAAHFAGAEPDLDMFTKEEIDKAENGFLKLQFWFEKHEVTPMFCEVPMVSEMMRYGGTPDFYGSIDGLWTVLDLKTSDSGIYLENLIQLMGYALLLDEECHPVDQMIVLRVGKTESQSPEVKVVKWESDEADLLASMWDQLLEIYKDTKILKKKLGVS
jgi:hypothetical protein